MTAPKIDIIEPKVEDAQEISDLIMRSFVELCENDHGNDPETIGLFQEEYSRSKIEEAIQSSNRKAFIMKHGDEIVAYGQVITRHFDGMEPYSHLETLYVLPDYKRTKLGTKLLQHLEKFAKSKKHEKMTVAAFRSSHPFYEGHLYFDVWCAGFSDSLGKAESISLTRDFTAS